MSGQFVTSKKTMKSSELDLEEEKGNDRYNLKEEMGLEAEQWERRRHHFG